MPFGLDDAALLAGGLSSLIGGSGAQSQANDLQNQALRLKLQDYTALLPLRAQGLNRLTAPMPQPENLDRLFADPGNPYARSGHLAAPMLPSQDGFPPSQGGSMTGTTDWIKQQLAGGGVGVPLGTQYAQQTAPLLPPTPADLQGLSGQKGPANVMKALEVARQQRARSYGG